MIWKIKTKLFNKYYKKYCNINKYISNTKITNIEYELSGDIFALGQQIIGDIKSRYLNYYLSRNDLRFLIHAPDFGHHKYYMDHLHECLRFMGVKSMVIPWNSQNISDLLFNYNPTVFLTIDIPQIDNYVDINSILKYKHNHQLLFLSSAVLPTLINDKVIFLESDLKRLKRYVSHNGPDLFYSLLEQDWWEKYFTEWINCGAKHISIPLAANPLKHYPVKNLKEYDWGIVTNNSDLGARIDLTMRYTGNIIKKYKGLIKGYNWGDGIEPIQQSEISDFLSHVRICPNPRVDSAMKYPTEIGGKVYELGAMGVFQIVSRTPALKRYYNDTELVSALNEKEFQELFDYYIDKPQMRYNFQINALKKTFVENTYFHRIIRLVEYIDKYRSN